VQSTANLSALVSANDSLSSFDARVQSLRHALTELLNNDEDLAGLFLTEKRATQDHGEAEELIENYLMQVEETSERIAELQTRFRNVMSYIQIHFDSQRNRLMRMSLVVSLGALSASDDRDRRRSVWHESDVGSRVESARVLRSVGHAAQHRRAALQRLVHVVSAHQAARRRFFGPHHQTFKHK
jgi:hypothetical protein